ncbi:hypothetical protein RF11_13452 [Thelohanellus kitauei]|uniref:Uncharacterized protein n=1 Tax=Thelohanellus kitauei TaxID=669202 RepID=A0A0C2MF76_THEKT|nr:hypothetical protein RF11_13452 [Thelohanellus kitauei]
MYFIGYNTAHTDLEYLFQDDVVKKRTNKVYVSDFKRLISRNNIRIQFSTDTDKADDDPATEDTGESACPGTDDSGFKYLIPAIEDNISDNTDNEVHDDDSGHSKIDISKPSGDSSGLKKYQIYMIMAIPFVLGGIVIPVYVYMFIRTHFKFC